MMYQLYQAQADLLLPLRQAARFGAGFARLMACNTRSSPLLRHLHASCSLFADAGLTHQRPA
ncbi:MAG: polyhydroxyalkanoate depolymerase, partial [Acetobacteraceae bacterium]